MFDIAVEFKNVFAFRRVDELRSWEKKSCWNNARFEYLVLCDIIFIVCFKFIVISTHHAWQLSVDGGHVFYMSYIQAIVRSYTNIFTQHKSKGMSDILSEILGYNRSIKFPEIVFLNIMTSCSPRFGEHEHRTWLQSNLPIYSLHSSWFKFDAIATQCNNSSSKGCE